MKLSSTSQKSADARVLSARRRDSVSGSTPIVLDLGGAGSEALRPPPPPSQRLGSISFQTTQLQTVQGARNAIGVQQMAPALPAVVLPKPSIGTGKCEGAATRSHSSPPGKVLAPSAVPASVRLSRGRPRAAPPRRSWWSARCRSAARYSPVGSSRLTWRSRPRGECHLPARQTNCRPSSLLDGGEQPIAATRTHEGL